MGISMLANFTSVLSSLFSWHLNGIKNIFVYLLKPIIVIIFTALNAVLSFVLYTVSSVLMQLIDFLELIFRLLAGLDVDGASMTFNGKTGDVLISIIRSEAVTQAFLAVTIVGLFLLVITTVFQMIKVEYTTEGAKNAKGPILEKAFKAICNLMLLPILCVFGIVIGNQVLSLIDSATKGGVSCNISSVLFVTAANQAIYNEGDTEILIPNNPTYVDIISGACGDIIDELKGENNEKPPTTPKEKVETIENNFLFGVEGFDKYRIDNISKYYKFTKINYLLLILGGCLIIKALYHCAFGMVGRLYKCIAYYIISPIAIGMSQIKESNLGTWRQKFIGEVLSAYGIVISMNLFFLVTGILMNVNFSFSKDIGPLLTSNFMSMLIKCIFIIVGALMIEKLSGDFVAYFGGSDAAASGKGLAQETSAMAQKAIGAAVTGAMVVGTGGMALAASGASKIKSFKNNGVKNTFGATFGAPIKNIGKKMSGVKDGFLDTFGINSKVNDAQRRESDYENRINRYDQDIKTARDNGVSTTALEKSKSKYISDHATQHEADSKVVVDYTKRNTSRIDKQIARKGVLKDYISSGMGQNILTKGYKQATKGYGDHMSSAAQKSDYVSQSVENIKSDKSKSKKEGYDSFTIPAEILELGNIQKKLLTNKIVDAVNDSFVAAKKAIDKYTEQITEFEQAPFNQAKNVYTVDNREYTPESYYATLNDLKQQKEDKQSEIVIDPVRFRVTISNAINNMDRDPKAIEKAIKTYMEEAGAQGNEKLLKKLEEILKNTLSDMGGASK